MDGNDFYILLVEDNPDDVELTQMAFKQNNFANDIHVVDDGQKALDFLLEDSSGMIAERGYPILILLDLKLPKVDGHEVLKELKTREKIRRIPVVILTSSKQEEDIIRGYELGANSFVRKPVSYSDFVNVVNQMGVYWLAINEKYYVDR